MSSMIFLAVSTVLFIIIFGFMFLLTPMILGSLFTVFDDYVDNGTINENWANTYAEIEEIARWILPLVMAAGLVLLILKILLIAGVRGDD